MRAAGYIRVSTQKQVESGGSLDEQVELIRERAARDEVELVDLFIDGAKKGWVPFGDRPAAKRMLELAPTLERIYIWKFDRFGRTAIEMLTVAAQLRQLGCHVSSLTEASIEDTSADGDLIRGISALLAERETAVKSDRGKLGASGRFRRGHYNGPAPLGYVFVDGLLEAVEHEVAIVVRIFTEFVGGKNLSAIARGLNDENIPTKRGGKWRQGTISALIRNPVYVGIVRTSGKECPGVHAPILDQELFDAAQLLASAMSTRKGGGRGRPPKLAHLFVGGSLRCGECGEAMTPRSGVLQRGGAPHYMCAGRQNLGCQMPYVKRAAIDEAVYSYFEIVGLDVEATRGAITEARDRKLAEVRSLLTEAEREAQRAEERLTRVRRDYAEGKLDADDWRSFRDELAADQDGAAAEVARLRAQALEVRGWTEGLDAEREALQKLSEIRAAIVGEVRAGEGVEAVRAALARLFSSFVLHRDTSSSAPTQVHAELLGAAGFVIEPVIRDEAIEHFSSIDAPILRREPLGTAGNKQRQGVGYRLVEGSV